MIKNKKEEYTWQEIVEITKNAGGRIYSLPFGDFKDKKFILKTIKMSNIKRDFYLTLKDCREMDLDEDEFVIRRLIKAYKNGENVPPIIVNERMEIIDGSHRTGSMYELKREEIDVYAPK